MAADHRKNIRRKLRRPALLRNCDGLPLGDCLVIDISETGARLRPKGELDPSEEFYLVLATQGDVKRRCKVIWQSPKEIGVRFIAETAAPA